MITLEVCVRVRTARPGERSGSASRTEGRICAFLGLVPFPASSGAETRREVPIQFSLGPFLL